MSWNPAREFSFRAFSGAVPGVRCILERSMQQPEPVPESLSAFASVRVSSVSSFFDMVVRSAHASPECHVMALVLLDRLRRMQLQRGQQGTMGSSVGPGLYLTALLVAAKLHDDDFYGSKHYASLAGVSTAHFNVMETELLQLLDFDLTITKEQFEQYESVCSNAAAGAAQQPPRPVQREAPVERVAAPKFAAPSRAAPPPAPPVAERAPPRRSSAAQRYVPPHLRGRSAGDSSEAPHRVPSVASASGSLSSARSSGSPSPCSSATESCSTTPHAPPGTRPPVCVW